MNGQRELRLVTMAREGLELCRNAIMEFVAALIKHEYTDLPSSQ